MHFSSGRQTIPHRPGKAGSKHLWALPASIVLALAVASPLSAQKTDIVTLHNGDKLTGEIKELDHAKLKYSTDDISTIYIEWAKIARFGFGNRVPMPPAASTVGWPAQPSTERQDAWKT